MPQESANPPPNAGRPRTLVTGASRRVGRAIALEFARAGHDLALTWRNDEAGAQETVRLAAEAARERGLPPPSLVTLRLDLADPAEVEAFPDRLGPGPLDVMVHNASLYEPRAFGAIDATHAEAMFRVHAIAPLLLTQAFAPRLRSSALPAGGSVVMLGDLHAAGRPYLRHAAYLASKAALHGLVESLAIELAPRVRVNAVAPGVVAWPEGADPAMRASYESRIPLARPGTPDDAAACVRWLALEAAYVTGAILPLDGGRRLR
jgi:pteridine reductase